jgi:hypothetical protein
MPALSVNKLFDKLGVQKGKTLSRQEVGAYSKLIGRFMLMMICN